MTKYGITPALAAQFLATVDHFAQDDGQRDVIDEELRPHMSHPRGMTTLDALIHCWPQHSDEIAAVLRKHGYDTWGPGGQTLAQAAAAEQADPDALAQALAILRRPQHPEHVEQARALLARPTTLDELWVAYVAADHVPEVWAIAALAWGIAPALPEREQLAADLARWAGDEAAAEHDTTVATGDSYGVPFSHGAHCCEQAREDAARNEYHGALSLPIEVLRRRHASGLEERAVARAKRDGVLPQD